jgi:hypothetical protein
VAARERADLAELADWVEGLRAAAHKAREEGDLRLAEALDITRFEVYEVTSTRSCTNPVESSGLRAASPGFSTYVD